MFQILVIEDDPITRITTEKYLKDAGHHTITAENGKVGVYEAINHQPDLILCDIVMPEINGYEVLNTLKKNKNTVHIPFIFLTAKESKEDFREGMNLGADDYLMKPINSRNLLDVIELRLEKKASQRLQVKMELGKAQEYLQNKSSHEYNTPLSGIILSADLALQRYSQLKDDDIKILLKNILFSAKILENTVQNERLYQYLLEAEEDEEKRKLYADGVFESPKDSLEEITQELAEIYEREDDIILETQNTEIHISEQNFRKIIHELIENALKFSKKGSKVNISTSLQEDYFIMQIKDEGLGMTEEQITEIDAYKQFNREIKEQQGLGLGLYITRKLLKFNRGKLSIESLPEKGTKTTAYFSLKALKK